mgnify:CR=1 FL=1
MKTPTTKSILAVAVWLTFALLSPLPSTASECIVSGETKFATIAFGGETHSYYFWAEAGQGVVIEMGDLSSVPGIVPALGGLEPRVQLYDPDGVRIADSGWDYSRARIENVRRNSTDNCPLEKRGTYTIVASDADGSYGGFTNEVAPDTGDYGLSLVVTRGTTTSIQDRDGGDLTVGRAVNGTITPGGDLDAYGFYGQIGQGVSIEMTDLSSAAGLVPALAGLEPRVQLYDPNGVRVADSQDPDFRYSRDYSRARIENYQLQMRGVYTMVLSDADGSYGGFTNEVAPDAGEYGLAVAVMPPKNPYGLYPYDPQPPDGNSVDLCDWDTLSWWPVDGVTGYDVYFANGPCMPLEKVAENIQDPYVPMPAVEEEQVCTWRVVAHTPTGDIQGPTWWFVATPCESCGLTISVIGQGSIVDPNVGFNEYPCGEIVSVTAVADPNYEFVRWEGSAVDANKVVPQYQDPMGSKISVTVDDAYTLRAVFEELLFDLPLDSDLGWIMDGQWEFGTPTGQGGAKYGNPDPTSGHTGQNVFGVNLNGDYDTAIGGPYSLRSAPVNMAGYNGVKLRFWRWLNTDAADYVKCSLEVSRDGNIWSLVWQNPEREEIADSVWSLVERDISSLADGQLAVYLRWTYHVLRERAYPYSSWNLDDIQLSGKRK